MTKPLNVALRHPPVLDPDFLPASMWIRAYHRLVEDSGGLQPLSIALLRPDGSGSVHSTCILTGEEETAGLNRFYIERLLKFLLWQKGGSRVFISGDREVTDFLTRTYHPNGLRKFDFEFMGGKVYDSPMVIEYREYSNLPEPEESSVHLGGNFDGCRIGFDLGGSDRKSAAVIDGEIVFSEEVKWSPYFASDPQYHIEGIWDSLRRAAEHLPRVDSIGGSAAGIYLNNEVRVASLFRSIGPEKFEKYIRKVFFMLKEKWNNVPFEVVNDGEATALAGSMAFNDTAVLGISMGTSQAGGYVDPQGHIKPWLNELAFVPVDYRLDAPVDEWSGDAGCGAQYFSQQAVDRLASIVGIVIPKGLSLPERLEVVQDLMTHGDGRAHKIFETIGAYLGYTIPHYADFYDFKHLLVLGRVTSGDGGRVILEKASEVMQDEFPELTEKISLHTPDEQRKRHGQAIAAASLPQI